MVDMDNVMTKLRRGMFVGLGTFGSTFVGNAVADFTPGGDLGTAAGELATGAGVSVAADEFVPEDGAIPNDAVEFAGYGIQGAAWAELADAVQADSTSGSVTEVDVTEVRRSSAPTPTANNRREEELSIDV